jgi:hypothetical protein
MKIKLFKLKNIINKSHYPEIKDILNNILTYKFDKNIEILKFLINELEDVVKIEPKIQNKPVSAVSKSKRDLSPSQVTNKKLMQLNSFKPGQNRPRSSVTSSVKTQSSMYVTNINITNNIKLPTMNKRFKNK